MKRCLILFCLAQAIGGLDSWGGGVPEQIQYQGRVVVDNTNYHGNGFFKFALVDGGTLTVTQATASASVVGGFLVSISVTDGGWGYAAPPSVTIIDPTGTNAAATAYVDGGLVTGIVVNSAGMNYSASPVIALDPPPAAYDYITYWSNDGSSTTGDEPNASNTLNVINGLFSAALGGQGMVTIPSSVFSNQDVQLRVWFSDGSGFEQLHPDQRLRSVGYAMRADGVPPDSITSEMIAAGAVTQSDILSNAVNTVHIGDGALQTSDLATNAVTSGVIADGSIQPVDLDTNSFDDVFWKATGNSGTTPGAHFIGTRDNTALELKVNDRRFGRIVPHIVSSKLRPAIILGGEDNQIGADAYGSAILSGGAYSDHANVIEDAVEYSAIVGGASNRIARASEFSLIGGGLYNHMGTSNQYSVIAGGILNSIEDDHYANAITISGGRENRIIVGGGRSTIGGGEDNTIEGTGFFGAPALGSTIGGGIQNYTYNNYATIPGGYDNRAHAYSFAAGYRAKATNSGCFVWADQASTDPFGSTESDQFAINADAGILLVKEFPNNGMNILNHDNYTHNSATVDFGNGGSPFIVASVEGDSETAGIFGDGNSLCLWSPGDGAPGQNAAYLYILDEDNWSDGDSDPYDNSALVIYLNNSGVWTASDRRRKNDLKPIQGATEKIRQLSGYTYEYKQSPEDLQKNSKHPRRAGLVAQELKEVLPEAVEVNDAGDHFVNYSAITPLLVEALKEQTARIEALEQRIAELEGP